MHLIKEQQEIIKASKILAVNFMDDPLYVYIFKNVKNKREAMNIFFYSYLKFLMPYSDLITDSEEMNIVGAVWFSDRMNSSAIYSLRIVQFVLRLTRLIPLIGFVRFLDLLKTIDKMSSLWIDKHIQSDYIHLDLAVVDEEKRGFGLFSKYIQFIEKEYYSHGDYYTLETQNHENVKKYTHLGFELVEEISLPNSPLVQYCMIKKQ